MNQEISELHRVYYDQKRLQVALFVGWVGTALFGVIVDSRKSLTLKNDAFNMGILHKMA